MITLDDIHDPNLKLQIDKISSKENSWVGTAFENYNKLNSLRQGVIGEIFVSSYLEKKGSIIEPRSSRGHDRIIDSIKTEIKFSLSRHINHMSICKDWERCIACILRPKIETSVFVWFTKQTFIEIIQTTDIFRHQQAGKSKGNVNDDYILDSNKRLDRLMSFPGVHNILTWKTNAILY